MNAVKVCNSTTFTTTNPRGGFFQIFMSKLQVLTLHVALWNSVRPATLNCHVMRPSVVDWQTYPNFLKKKIILEYTELLVSGYFHLFLLLVPILFEYLNLFLLLQYFSHTDTDLSPCLEGIFGLLIVVNSFSLYSHWLFPRH